MIEILLKRVGLLGLSAFLFGCATKYEDTAKRSWELMKRGDVDTALKLYENDVVDSKEALLRLMDEGILLRVGGKFAESNQKFLAAARLIEQSGYLSLGEQSVSVLSNEKQTTYQGEDFEKVLIHLYLSLNFIELKDFDSALVSARRVNEILYKMISEAKRPYELNVMARYLGGALFENDRDYNNALVSYKGTRAIDPGLLKSFQALAWDLIRMTKEYGSSEDLAAIKKEVGEESTKNALESLGKNQGALLVVFESGKSPEKYSSREYHQKERKGGTFVEVMVPVTYYRKRPSRIARLVVAINGKKSQSVVLNDIEATAIQHLKDRMGRMVAKALLTAGVKAGIAAGVGAATNSQELGLLTGLALMLTSEADTRSWLLLPGQFQVAKVFLPPGSYDADLSYLDIYGSVAETEKIQIQIKPGKLTFLQRRKFD